MSVEAALQAWRLALGAEHVVTDAQILASLEKATFATRQRVPVQLRPGSRADVQACVRIANEHRVPIYPVSRGKNWGLGSRVPVQDGCAVLDLERLNRIVGYDEKLAYLTVEPGVTFRQAHEYLRERGSPLLLSVIGGPADASLIGNAVDRGNGLGPYGDRAAQACALEVVLPTGNCIRTGFGRFASASATHAYRWGVGPAMDGLFTQSNLGIVTEMTVWLMPRSRFFQFFQFTVPSTAQLGPVVDALQSLLMHGVLQDNCLVLSNCYKVLMRAKRYPWQMTGGRTPFSIKERTGSEPWYANGQLYAPSRERGLADRALVEQALAPHVTQLQFFDQDSHDLLNNPELGVPSDSNLKALYWRKRKEVPARIDPDGDLCGVIWFCPVLPFDGDMVVQALQMIEPAILRHGFEPNANVTCVSSRAVHVGVVLVYDREVPGEDERAMQCHDHLLEQLVKKGHIPGRLGIQSMDQLPRPDDHSSELIRILKQALDPNDILAPGRYDFRTHWPAQDRPK